MATITRQEAQATLARLGVPVADWAKANNIPVRTVYRVLDGTAKCERGDSRRAAVLLGIREGEILRKQVSLTGPLRSLVKAAEEAR